MSKADDIAASLSDRLALVQITNGYLTDIGIRVFRGRRRVDQTMLPCAVIIERGDEPKDKRGTLVKLQQHMGLEGHMACDADNPNDVAHKMIADLKRAVFAPDGKLVFGAGTPAISLEYRGSAIAAREDGLAVISVSVEIGVEYAEDLASP